MAPIKPKTTSNQTASTTNAAKKDAKTDATKKDAKPDVAKQDAKTPAATKPGIPRQFYKNPSPLQKQHKAIRGQPDYTPVSISFLTGAYRGQTIDLGLAVNEISHSGESAEWESQKSDSIRPGLNFKSFSNREISFTATFFDINEDVSHLAENCQHLKEITGDDKSPPRLLYTQGDLRAVECVCTKADAKFSDPLPGRKGYRQATVDLSLKLIGGNNNANALGGPLTSTPLADWKNKTTEADRKKQGRLATTELLMADCLKEKGSAELKNLIQNDKQADVSAISALSPQTFVQSAVAGVFSAETLKDAKLQEKLKQDLALVMAQNSDGIGNTTEVRAFATALRANDPSILRKKLQDDFAIVKPDYEAIATAIQEQKLDESADIFNRNNYATAGTRLYDLGSCGLGMRRNGAAQLEPVSKEDAKVLKDVNDFFKGNPTDAQVKERFGLENESQVRAVKNGSPYQTKGQFVDKSSKNKAGLTGYALWSNFDKNTNKDAAKVVVADPPATTET